MSIYYKANLIKIFFVFIFYREICQQLKKNGIKLLIAYRLDIRHILRGDVYRMVSL